MRVREAGHVTRVKHRGGARVCVGQLADLALSVLGGVCIGKQFITILNKNSLELWV